MLVMIRVSQLVAINAVRVLRRIDCMLMHAERVRMAARGAVVPGSASQHRRSSKALDRNRQGQQPHQRDSQNAQHLKSLIHR